MDKRTIDKRFSYQAPSPDMVRRMQELRTQFRETAQMINELCPDGNDKETAIQRLEDAMIWANKAVIFGT